MTNDEIALLLYTAAFVIAVVGIPLGYMLGLIWGWRKG